MHNLAFNILKLFLCLSGCNFFHSPLSWSCYYILLSAVLYSFPFCFCRNWTSINDFFHVETYFQAGSLGHWLLPASLIGPKQLFCENMLCKQAVVDADGKLLEWREVEMRNEIMKYVFMWLNSCLVSVPKTFHLFLPMINY